MRLIKSLFICAVVLGVVSCNQSAIAGDVNEVLADFVLEEERGDWIAKVGDYKITTDEFEAGFEIFINQARQQAAQQGLEPPDETEYKQYYLENLISQYSLVIQALEEKTFDDGDMRAYLKSAMRDAIYRAYVTAKMPEDNAYFEPSQEEIDIMYSQYQEQFAQSGMQAAQIKDYLRGHLMQQNMQMWMEDFINQTTELHQI